MIIYNKYLDYNKTAVNFDPVMRWIYFNKYE